MYFKQLKLKKLKWKFNGNVFSLFAITEKYKIQNMKLKQNIIDIRMYIYITECLQIISIIVHYHF